MPFPEIFFFNDTAPPEISTLSLHHALPICRPPRAARHPARSGRRSPAVPRRARSEEHTSELQSPWNFVCRLLLEKKVENRSFTHGGTNHPRSEAHTYELQSQYNIEGRIPLE